MRKGRFYASVWARLVAFELERELLPPGARVLAAVSGGPDSTCLAHYLAQRAKRLGLRVTLAHVHHGLRGRAADADAAFVLGLGKRLGLPVETARADVRGLARSERRSLEDAARKARYDALAALARRRDCSLVATGHTLSDHAETVLLHLLRGTQPEGLLGIPARRPLPPGLEVVRPLLRLRRDDVLGYLRYFKLRYRNDASNRDEALTRNWVRRNVIPLLKKKNPKLEENLGILSDNLCARLSPFSM